MNEVSSHKLVDEVAKVYMGLTYQRDTRVGINLSQGARLGTCMDCTSPKPFFLSLRPSRFEMLSVPVPLNYLAWSVQHASSCFISVLVEVHDGEHTRCTHE